MQSHHCPNAADRVATSLIIFISVVFLIIPILGYAWATGGLGDSVETVGGAVIEPVHQVAVSVDGHQDRGVPQPSLDGFGMLTGGDQPRCVGMAQVVDPTGSTNRLCDRSPPDPPERRSRSRSGPVGTCAGACFQMNALMKS